MDPRRELPPTDILALREIMLGLADEVRALILERVGGGELEVSRKVDRSFVTSADKDAERLFRERLAQVRPHDAVLGEEEGLAGGTSDFLWVIDPVDGTEELVNGLPYFGTVIGLFYKNLPVAGLIDHPRLQTRTHAAFGHGCFRNGTRMILEDRPYEYPYSSLMIAPLRGYLTRADYSDLHRALIEAFPNYRSLFCCFTTTTVAGGGADAGIDANVNLWDIASAQILIEEAGGEYHQWTYPGPGNETLYMALYGRPGCVKKLHALTAPFMDR